MVKHGVRWTVLFALAACSCSLFSPRPSQPPLPTANGRVDPLNFSALVQGTNYHFTKFDYEDLFYGDDANQIYDDQISGYFSKNDLIGRLDQIQTKYPDDTVWWDSLHLSQATPTIVLISNAKYYFDTSRSPGVPPMDSGTANFTLVDSSGYWQISQWVDNSSRQGASFFSPQYKQ